MSQTAPVGLDSEPPARRISSRLISLDALRGLVMILMALDHVRDFFHRDAALFAPTDLSRTTTILFLTRWITHFCLPVFMFAAGTGAFLWWQRSGRTKRQLSRFLWTRGLCFVILELTVMRFAYNFSFSSEWPVFLLILWIFGICMILLAVLVHLPVRVLAPLSLLVIALHNAFDSVNTARFGKFGWAWNLVHQPGLLKFSGHAVLVTYTVVPWIAVLAIGFCFGPVLLLEPSRRQRIGLRLGVLLTLLFALIRAMNVYGDPTPWSHQKTTLLTVLSFLNCTKYPASLDFLLMTLGPALLLLVFFDRHPPKPANPLVVFGRVPLFYFVLHFYLIHIAIALMSLAKYGASAFAFIFKPLITLGGPREAFPAGFGYNLAVVYLFWILIVVLLYPLCRWYANLKATRRHWWLSYV